MSIWGVKKQLKVARCNNMKPFAPLFLLLLPFVVVAAPPTGAVKFVILDPNDSIIGVPVSVTIQAQKSNNKVDTNYQDNVTLVASGSATGGGLVEIVNGTGVIEINDNVAEAVTLSLSDTEETGLDVSSTQDVIFTLSGAGVWNQIKFKFRDAGTEAGATGYGNPDAGQNAGISVNPDYVFRLRFLVKVTGADGAITPRLEFKEDSGDCTAGDWTTVTSSTKNIQLQFSPDFEDGEPTTQQLATGSSFTAGAIFDSTNPGPRLILTKQFSTEYEWSLKISPTVPLGASYIFRITNNGTVLDSYGQCPGLSVQKGGVSPTIVTFSGSAFPEGEIFIVNKDIRFEKVLSREVAIGKEGDFHASFVGVLQGQNSFSLRIKDKDGRITQSKFFNIDTISSSLTKKEILVPPTLGFVKSAVTRGESAVVLGYASPGHKVRAEIDGKIKVESGAGNDGSYSIIIPTGELEFGAHSISAKQVNPATKQESDLSPLSSFTVSRLQQVNADLNGDNAVDIRDWSIFLARWGSKQEGSWQQIDFNSDGKVDVSDFSIFIRSIRRK